MIHLAALFWATAGVLFFLSHWYIKNSLITFVAFNVSFTLYVATSALLFFDAQDLLALFAGVVVTFKALTVLRVLINNYKFQYHRGYNDMILLHLLAFILVAAFSLPIGFELLIYYEFAEIIALCIVSILFVNVIFNLKNFRISTNPDREIFEPSVSLLIPARNERHAMDAALKSALEIDYKKLEIIVIDDESQDNTPEIIKSFAHDGVRFIEGGGLPEGWIGKNYALQRLSKEASGSILLFCDVDVRLDTDALKEIIEPFSSSRISLVSVFPKLRKINYQHLFIQTLEALRKVTIPYWAVPGLKPASSSCWAMRKSTLREMNDFELTKSALAPHYYFSERLEKSSQKFIVAGPELNASIRKKFSSEIETRVRRFYPGIGGSILNVLFVTLFTFLILYPFIGILLSLITGASVSLINVISVLLILLAHTLVLYKTSPKLWFMGIVNFLPSVLLELLILYWSFFVYEFGTVTWKDRELPSSYVLQSNI